MTDALKQEYTLRITNANKSGLIIIIYELALSYLNSAYHAKSRLPFRRDIQYAQDCIDELIHSLDFHYDIAKNLYSLYVYAAKELTLAHIGFNAQRLEPIIKMLTTLSDAYSIAAVADNSPPVMQNSQKVYAGLTYGKNDIDESAVLESGRGFFA